MNKLVKYIVMMCWKKLSEFLSWGLIYFNTRNFIKQRLFFSMKAKFKTICISCNSEITPGKEIGKDDSGKWVHKHCLTESLELP